MGDMLICLLCVFFLYYVLLRKSFFIDLFIGNSSSSSAQNHTQTGVESLQPVTLLMTCK